MWWSKAFLLVALLGLGACGFQPMYARDGGQSSNMDAQEMAAIRIRGIENRTGQILRTELIQRLTPGGEPGNPRYQLTVTLMSGESGIAESSDGKTSVGSMNNSASFTLADMEGRVLSSGTAESGSSYRYLGPRYGSVASERDTQERALQDLAENIRMQVGAVFARRRAANARPN